MVIPFAAVSAIGSLAVPYHERAPFDFITGFP
jgi:hypothetical protein